MAHELQKRILLVEDEAITARAEKNKLQKYGYDVVTALSGSEAVKTALSDTHIDLILMDINLGSGIDGTEAAAQILKEKDIPVVFLSSHTAPEIVDLTEKITSYGYVVKNTGITVLDASIKMAFKLFDANRAVREKEKLLLSIAENYPNSYISIIEKDYTIGFSSGQEFKNLNLDPESYIGCTLEEIFREHSETVKEYYRRTFEGDECSFELFLNNQQQFYKTVPLYSEDKKIHQILTVVENVTNRKKTEEKLKESEEKFRMVYEHMSVGIAEVSLDFKILSANDAYCKMLGYREDELIGKNIKDITHPESLDENIHQQERLVSGDLDYFRLKKTFIHKKGHALTGILDANLIRDSHGKPLYFLGSVLNITDSEKHEEGFHHKQDLLESMFSNIQGISYRCALDKDWTMKHMSPHAEHLTGYPREDFLNNTIRTFESIIHRDDTAFVTEVIHKAVNAGIPWEVEYRIIHKSGELRHFYEKGKAIKNSDGSVDHLDGLIIDITEKTAMEEKLRESQEQLLQAEFIAGIGNFSWNIKNGRVSWSEGMYKLLKYDLNEHIDYNKVKETIHHPDDLEDVTRWLVESIDSGEKNVAPREYRLVQKDGSTIYVQTKGRIAYRNGEPDIFFGTCQDITLRKTTELQLQESENRYRLLANNSADLIWTCGTGEKNFPFTYINPAVEEMLGYKVEEFLELPLQNRWTTDSLKIFTGALEGIADSGETAIFQLQHVHKSGKIVDCELSVNPVYNTKGRITGFQGRTIDITVRKMAEELLVDQTNNLISRINELNCLYGLSKLIEKTDSPLEEIYQESVNLLPPAWQFPLLTCARLVFDKKEYTTDNYRDTPWQISCDIFIQNIQRGVFTVGYLTERPNADEGPFRKEEKALLNEIAERLGHLTEHRNTEGEIKRLLEEKKIFLKEIHHRIKNNMAMVEGLLSLQMDTIKNPDAVSALQNSINRVTGMRILYDKLIITDDYEMLSVSQYINDLIDSIFSTFPPEKEITISRNISNFQLSSKVLFPLGIILNELLTNVLKYAFEPKDKGDIQVSITSENSKVTLSIRDNGKGLPEGFDAADTDNGFGLLLVQMLTKQLRGNFTITGSQGTMSVLEFDAD